MAAEVAAAQRSARFRHAAAEVQEEEVVAPPREREEEAAGARLAGYLDLTWRYATNGRFKDPTQAVELSHTAL